jgi:starch phosphorylase
MQSELAKLIQQYGCGSVRFTGIDEALYERHLVFDNVMEMSEIGARERFEAIAHPVRDVFWRSAGFIRERRTSVKMRSKFYYPSMEFSDRPLSRQ